MSGSTLDQALEVLKRTDNDYNAKCQEVQQYKQKLVDAQLELERCRATQKKTENEMLSLQRELNNKQGAIDIVVKELTAKKTLVEQLNQENARLRRDMEGLSKHAGEMATTLKAKTATNVQLTMEGNTPATLYVAQCFSIGVDPSMDILRSLFTSTAITCTTPVTYQQLSCLVDVFRAQKTINASGWAPLQGLTLHCASEEAFALVQELLPLLPSLESLSMHSLGDLGAQSVAGALSVADHICRLELPALRTTDAGLQSLLKVISSREQLCKASDGNPPMLILPQLDLSHCTLTDPKTFDMIHGNCIERIDLSGSATLQNAGFASILLACPALVAISVANCPSLTDDIFTFVNASKGLRELNIVGCCGLSKVKLTRIEVLHTNMAFIAILDCPLLEALPVPITQFQCVSWVVPQLKDMTIHRLLLTPRELEMLSSSTNLTSVTLVQCRVQGLDQFLRKLRKLVHLSLHSCKGVVDQDVLSICSTVEWVDLTDSYCLTDRCMPRLGDYCRSLTHLTIKRCSNITDVGLASLETSQTLKELNVLGAKKITVLGLHRLISKVKSLERIIHNSLVSPSVRVDHEDDEEEENSRLKLEERSISVKRDELAVAFASPKRGDGARGASGSLSPTNGLGSDNNSPSRQPPVGDPEPPASHVNEGADVPPV